MRVIELAVDLGAEVNSLRSQNGDLFSRVKELEGKVRRIDGMTWEDSSNIFMERAEKAEARVKAAAEASIAEERRKAEEAQRALEAEQRRQREEKEAEDRRLAAEAAEAERRRKDREHAGRVMGAAKEALMEHAQIDEEASRRVVKAIVAGSIPSITLSF